MKRLARMLNLRLRRSAQRIFFAMYTKQEAAEFVRGDAQRRVPADLGRTTRFGRATREKNEQ